MADTVIAHHDYEAQQDDELSLKKGDIIQVTDSSNTDWWVGKNQDGKTGVFPSNFVEANEEPVKDNKDEATIPVDSKPIPENNQNDKEEEVTDEPAKQVTHPIGRARVMEDYAMQNDDEITLHKGSIITLYEKLDDDWFKGEINGKHGKFPSKYVEEIDIPGRPDIGAPSGGHIENSGPSSSSESKVPAGGFKLAAFGVKQGGIGSVLAGGFPTLKKTSAAQPVKQQQQPVSTSNDHHESSSSIPTRTSTVESIPSPVSTSNESTDSPVKKSQVKAIVLHPYEAENEDELNLIRGEYIEVLDQNLEEDGWWKGKNEKNQIGIFPSNFVKEIELDQHAAPPVRTSRKSVTSVGSTTKASSFNDTTTNATAGTGTARPSSVPSVSRLPPLPDTRPNTIASSHILTTQQQQQQPSIKEEDANEDQQEINDTIKEQEEKENEQEQVEEKEVPAPLEIKANDEKEQNENVEPLNVDEITTKDNVDEQLKDDQKPEASPAVDITPTIAPRPTEILNAEQKEEVKEEEEEKEEKQVQKDDVKEVEVESKPVVETPKEDEDKVVEEEPKEEEPKEDEKKENIASTNDDEEKEEKEKDEATPSAEEVEQQKQEETETVEKKNDFGILPTAGPRLTSPARASRPTQRSTPRRPPTTTTATSHEPSQTELLQQEIEKTPDVPEKKESAEESAVSPPPKPVKPIFAKFPTPFAGMGNNNENPLKNLKPVQRRMFEPVPAHESSSAQHDNNNDNNNNDNSDTVSPPPKPAGVRNLASRFAGIPSSGGNDVLETKLKNFTKNEVEKLRKELALEKSQREQLEELVQSLADKIELLQQQINS
ncbi:hypothetical protein BJ944DRAFT_276892 [Cunninghamella echinulata]|nr:hypothetical protein BJ944DRAFT_276892 [Cunninghamella echinulata]